MTFDIHPSHELVALYRKRPYQGQSPEQAAIIFLSSDANYSPKISNHPFFGNILEYHKDGVAFWKRSGCHHPFLLPGYPFDSRNGGVPFHRNFSKLGLGPQHAEHVSFLELLNVPTIGNRSENKGRFFELLSLEHLRYIDDLVLRGGHKLFFVPGGVLRDIAKIMKSHAIFTWYDGSAGITPKFSKTINGNMIKESPHFSSAQIHGQVTQIRSEIDRWIEKGK
jgi:hypothetical protein